MSNICFAAAMSHTAQMHRCRDVLPETQDAEIYGAIERLSSELRAARPDLLILMYGDHYSYFTPKNMPAICVGIADEYQTFGDAGVPVLHLPGNQKAAARLTGQLMEKGFDVAWSSDLSPDHGAACPLHLMNALDIPVIPIRINSIAPPLISMRRAHEFGCAIGDIVRGWGPDCRVGILGTGGLSHFLPFPDPLDPHTPEEIEMVTLMSDGSNARRLSELVIKRVTEVREDDAGQASINEQFDRQFLDDLAHGNIEPLLGMTTEYVARHAGNGGQEVRNWVAVSGAVGDGGAEVLCYQPAAPWLTGIAIAQFPTPGQ